MQLIRYLTLRSLLHRPLRMIFSLFGITIGVAGILALGTTNQAALQSITRLFEDTSGRTDLVVTTAGSDSGFPEAVARSILGVPGVEHALPLVKVQTALASQAAQNELGLSFFGMDSGGLLLHGIDAENEPLARDYRIVDGRFLSTEAEAYEIVLVENFAEDEEITVGDRIGILTPGGVERVRVVGLMAREGPGQTNNGIFGIIPVQTAQQMFSRRGEVDQFDLILSRKDSSSIAEVQAELQKRLRGNYSVTYPAGQGKRMTQMLSNYQIGLNFLSGIALFVGAFLIYNTFGMTVVERTREFGMLRAIGMTRGQIVQQMLAEALGVGLLGSLLGVALGIAGSRGLAGLMSTMLGSQMDTRIEVQPELLVLSMAVGVLVTLLAAAIPSLNAGKISPIAAIKIRGLSRDDWLVRRGWILGLVLLMLSTGLLIRNPFVYDPQFRLGSMTVFAMFAGVTLIIPKTVEAWEKLTRPVMAAVYGASGALGSRNIQRSRSRTSLTVGALLIGVAMILVVRSMTGSFAADLKVWINAYLGGDLYIASSVPLRADIARQISEVNGVKAVSPVRYQPVDMRLADGTFESITFMAVEPASYSRVTSFVFSDSLTNQSEALSKLAEGGTIFISSVLAEKHGLKAGGQVILKTRSGPQTFTIAAEIVDFFNQGAVVTGNWNDLRHYFHTNEANTILVRVDEAASISEVKSEIDQFYGKRYHLNIVANDSIRARVNGLMEQAFSLFDVMAVLAVAVASLGVVNTLTMNVIERTREIGMLRATGMTRKQVVLMVLAEAGLMGMIGGLLGLVFGVLLSRIFLTGMTAMSGYRLDFVVPLGGVITGLLVSLVVSQLAALAPAQRAARTRVLDAIQYE